MRNELKGYIAAMLVLQGILVFLLFRFPLLPVFTKSFLEEILTSDDTFNALIGLIIGLISSVVFSYFKEYLPNKTRQENTINTLNTIIASVIDSYNRVRIFGHETSLKHIVVKA